MFDFIRQHTKVTMALLVFLIVPSFILVGLEGYSRDKDNAAVVAKVDGQAITQTDWDRAHLREVERLRANQSGPCPFGMPSLDPKLRDSPEAKYATLERLVCERVFIASAKITKDYHQRQLLKIPEMRALRASDGKVDMDQYRKLLAEQGMTIEIFEADFRERLPAIQVFAPVSQSSFVSNMAADMALNAYFEKREIQVAGFSTTEYAAKLNPSDAELEQFYKANESLFQAPEQANIEYVLLDVETIKKGITVNEAELKDYFDQNAALLSGTEERRASHILIASPKSASEAERQKAKAKAAELLALVKKSPNSFADVAKKNSQDPGSAPSGGVLDFFTRSGMVKPFSDAAFAMQKGDISDLVESEFGYHIIKLTDVKMPKQRSFEEMKPELTADVKKQQAQKKFAETAETFTNGVYEQADSLTPVSDRLKLDIKTANGITRTAQPGATGALANPKFLNAIFSPDAIEKKRNTEAVEVASNQLISGRITQYTPARTRPLLEVKELVRQRWLAMRGAEDARKDGIAKLAAWKAAPASATLQDTLVVSRDQTQRLPPKVVEVALRTDATALPVFAGVDLGTQGYAIVKVTKVLSRDPALEATAKQERLQYAQWWTSAESLAFYNVLKERFKTEIKVAKPVRAAAGQQANPDNSVTR